jgi:hypothetical protein
MTRIIDLTDREWRLLEELRSKRRLADVARAWNTHPQNITNAMRGLIDKGAVVPVKDVPWWTANSERYPLTIPADAQFRYKPVLPPSAELIPKHAPRQWGKLIVNPIRFVRWEDGRWSVQGLPTVRPDGKHSWERLPEHRIVWAVHDSGDQVMFDARVDTRWFESWTALRFVVEAGLELDADERRALTLCVAASVGVEAVLDLTALRSAHPENENNDNGGTGE